MPDHAPQRIRRSRSVHAPCRDNHSTPGVEGGELVKNAEDCIRVRKSPADEAGLCGERDLRAASAQAL